MQEVRDFIQQNYTPYDGDGSFLAGATDRTLEVWKKVSDLMREEQKSGILDLDTSTPSTITSHKPGFVDKDSELIVGLQTDAPLKRSIKPAGGIRLVEKAAESYGYKVDKSVVEVFTKYRKTHNDGVFDAYTDEHRLLRSKHIITGLPDNYGRGRIIGDYRRVALYGVDALIIDKKSDLANLGLKMDEKTIRIREEINEQIKALEELLQMAKSYGFDISKPAYNFVEAVQWLYFAYLGAVKQQDGAAMSMGRIDAFLDIYAERDIQAGSLNEQQVQETIDDFVIKLRMVRHLRTPEYEELFAGDPTWVTCVLGGIGLDGRHMVTKTSFRFLHTLKNLGPSPEPNLTILWSDKLTQNWKSFCAQTSIESSSIQYENDDLMREKFGDDYAIACCVSAMWVGKDMQFFGARMNLAKALLLAINSGKDEPQPHVGYKGGEAIIPSFFELENTETLDFDEVWTKFVQVVEWLAERYVGMMNIIHFMHDKYNYESLEMALHDSDVRRLMAFGIAGLSVVVDSLSAIKYANVKPVWTKEGVVARFLTEGEFPTYGNDDDRVDVIAKKVCKVVIEALRKHETYRNSIHTLSVLTITSNVVYGRSTGSTPDGRESGEPFAPGANPMHGRDKKGALASLNSVAKLDYDDCLDGISNTFSIVPESLGREWSDQIKNLYSLMDGYMSNKGGFHLNVNVLNRETLLDAQKYPHKYPQLTVRVSGYAVLFNRLNKYQQDEVIGRTFH